jgi:hypothetical protein
MSVSVSVRAHARWSATAALLVAGGLGGQQPAPTVPPHDALTPARLEREARRLIAAVPYPSLVTIGPDGAPQARPVQPRLPDSSWTVWVATNPRTRKVAEIARQPRQGTRRRAVGHPGGPAGDRERAEGDRGGPTHVAAANGAAPSTAATVTRPPARTRYFTSTISTGAPTKAILSRRRGAAVLT